MREREMQHVQEKRYISFSSGGTAGFAFIGCMGALEHLMGKPAFERWRGDLRGVAGTSAGALYGLMFSMGLTHAQTEHVKRTVDLRRCVSFTTIDQFHTRFGFSDTNEMRRYIQLILEEGGLSPNATMNDLHRFTRLECTFVASNIMRRRAETISHHTHPDMRVEDAVCASCAIPLLYHPVEHNDELLVDGCLTGCLPDVFERSETLFLKIAIPEEPRSSIGLVDYISLLFDFTSSVQSVRALGDRIYELRLRNTAVFDPSASPNDIQREGLLAALAAFTGADLYTTCGGLCKHYVRAVWALTEDDEVPPGEIGAPDARDPVG